MTLIQTAIKNLQAADTQHKLAVELLRRAYMVLSHPDNILSSKHPALTAEVEAYLNRHG
jgi:hypothetical protein